MAVKVKLVELGILSMEEEVSPPTAPLSVQLQGLNFDQQKEILAMQLEFENRRCEL